LFTSTRIADTKLHNFVVAKLPWCSVTGKVSVGLTS